MSNCSIQYHLQPEEQLCFLHIPKTAGTTLTSILESKFDRAQICPADLWGDLKDYSREDLAKYKLLRGHFLYDIYHFLPQKPVYVTMLRDPIDRIISAYEFMKTCIPIRPEAILTQQKALSMTLKEFVCDPNMPAIVNDQTRHISRDIRKQYPDLRHRDWLEIAKENLEQFAFFGLTEQFPASMALLAYTFGWQPIAELQNLMVGAKRTKRADLAQEVIDAIAERNQLDIELYQFGQQLFEQRYAQMLQSLAEKYPLPTSIVALEKSEAAALKYRLEQHYRSRYAALELPQKATIAFEFHRGFAGSGWHGYEGFGRTTAFRWTGPGTVSTLDFPLVRNQDLSVEFRVLNWITLDVLESLTLEVNDRPLPYFLLHRDEATILFKTTIPQAFLETDLPFTRLTFKVNRTLSPQSVNPNHPDTRRVGVAIDLIQIFPVDAAAPINTTAFLFESTTWTAVVEFLSQNLQAGELLFAPEVFKLRFPEAFPEKYFESNQNLQNYNPALMPTQKFLQQIHRFQWVVLHKGIKQELDIILQKLLVSGFFPVFANEVFVVFSNQPRVKKLSYLTPDVKYMYTGYLKDRARKLLHPLYHLLGHSKRLAQQNLEPEKIKKLQSVYQKYLKKTLE